MKQVAWLPFNIERRQCQTAKADLQFASVKKASSQQPPGHCVTHKARLQDTNGVIEPI